jgi:XTP/dITP diphosphohydrolase
MGFILERLALDLPEPQSLDPSHVVRSKVLDAWDRLRRPVLVEDSGLGVAAWGWFPGALVKWLEKAAGLEAMVRMVDAFPDRRARAVCALACFDGESLVESRGETDGRIATTPTGTLGFGWDPIFVPDGFDRTYAELSAAEKDSISHRGRAWKQLAGKLQAR